jgi:hypothetical protein
MKKLVLIVFIVLTVMNSLNAQEPYKKAVTWMGLDFTDAKLFTSAGFSSPEDIKDNFLESWNDLIIRESDKFNVAKYFGIDTLSYDLSVVKERNLLIPVDKLVVDVSPDKINEQNVKSIILQYPKTDGIGLVLIVESFDKPNTTGTFWATFFNRSTLKVLSTKRIQGQASGMGIRNYWGNSIYGAMKSISSKKVK